MSHWMPLYSRGFVSIFYCAKDMNVDDALGAGWNGWVAEWQMRCFFCPLLWLAKYIINVGVETLRCCGFTKELKGLEFGA